MLRKHCGFKTLNEKPGCGRFCVRQGVCVAHCGPCRWFRCRHTKEPHNWPIITLHGVHSVLRYKIGFVSDYGLVWHCR